MLQKVIKRHEQIIVSKNHVHRPAGHWTRDVHKFLKYLHTKGFDQAPKPIGYDKLGREVVSYVEGKVYSILNNNASSITALKSAAILLRAYHDASEDFISNNLFAEGKWQFPSRYRVEVMCHGDYAPYNVVLRGKKAVGIIDFDTVHPGSRSWDMAYALYRWAPLTNPQNHDGFGDIRMQVRRASIFCDAYGLPTVQRKGMSELIVERLMALIDFMTEEADRGHLAMQKNIADKHHLLYINDANYIRKNKEYIDSKL